MEMQLREQLLEGEQLLWSGQPEPFETLDNTNKTGIIVGLIIKVLATLGVMLVFYISARDGQAIIPGMIAFILVFAAYALASPFLIARRLRRRTFYGLTDKRILRVGTNDAAVPYDRIKRAVLRTDKDGRTTLLCGPRACDLKPRKWRGEADAFFINNSSEPEAERVILYALPMNSALGDILEAHLPLER